MVKITLAEGEDKGPKFKHGSSRARPGTRILFTGRGRSAWNTYTSRVRDLTSAETSLRGFAEGIGKAHADFIPKAEKRLTRKGSLAADALLRSTWRSAPSCRPAREGDAQRQATDRAQLRHPIRRMLGLAAGSLAFLADLQEDWIAHGKKVFPVLREKASTSLFRRACCSSENDPMGNGGGVIV